MRAIETTVPATMDAAEAVIRDALARQGFGILTEIDVAAALQAKLGIKRTPLKILGACNPTLAHEALQRDPAVALVLPCNIVVEPTTGGTRIAAVDPRELMNDERFTDLAAEAAARIRAALDDAADTLTRS